MKRKRFTQEQIAFARRQAEAGTPADEICRKLGVTEQSFYRWKKQYAGVRVTEIRRLRELEAENAKLKKLVADLTLDKVMLQDVARVTSGEARCSPAGRPPPGGGLPSERAAGLPCITVPPIVAALPLATRSAPELRMRLKELAAARVRHGYRRLHILLRREG